MPPKYRVYPSLLDKFQSLLDYEQEADAWWNKRGDEYILDPDQYRDKLERELIDAINRIPIENREAADRGTALNEIVDSIISREDKHQQCSSIVSVRDSAGIPLAVKADIGEFTFTFDINLVWALRERLRGSLCQYFVSATIDTDYGVVELYGYLDYWLRDRIIDLKTTSSKYEFGKYENHWQRWVYPYCVIESGETDHIESFIYLVGHLNKSAIIGGELYPEVYDYNHEQSKANLRGILEQFIAWLEEHRDSITDKKIFNQQQPQETPCK